MTRLPEGTVTFLFTDVEGSTRLLGELGEGFAEALAEHRRVVRAAVTRHGGVEVDTQGDAFFVAFARASDAVAAAAEAQAALKVPVRMGLHTGEPTLTDEGYVGMDVVRAARIAAAGHGRQVLLSEVTRDLVDVEVRDLGDHRLKDLSGPERIFQLGDGEFPRLRTLRATNLPVQPSPLIGRERELATVTTFLRDGVPVVTLTGAGGSGKTRLALHAAAELADRYADGAWFVPLATVSDASVVDAAIAEVAGADFRTRELLLVLDNVEHLLPAFATTVAELPVQALVTSRERLALRSEQAYDVPPLPEADAVRLFVDRARRVVPSFQPDDNVRLIVQRLDGLPLAIELAAARVNVLPPAQIRERLARSLELLTTGARDAPERHRTLRATISWSYELLDERRQTLFDRLGVFAGSFGADSAEEVVGATLDDLAALVDKSLLRTAADGRFFLLQSIREFVAERFTATPENESVRERLSRHLTQLFTNDSWSPETLIARRRRFVDELPNVRQTLAWLQERGRFTELLELTFRCRSRWEDIGAREEAYQWGEAALAPRVSSPFRLDVTMNAAVDAGSTGRFERALALIDEGLRLARAQPDRLAECLSGAAGALTLMRRYEEARRLLDEALALAPSSTSHAGVQTLHTLAELELAESNLAAAATMFERALDAARAIPGSRQVPFLVIGLGDVELERGAYSNAETRYREALVNGRELGVTNASKAAFAGLAAAAAAQGRDERAATLWGVFERLEATRAALPAIERERYAARVGHLDPELVARGRELAEDTASEYALAPDHF